ncbi:hypothetical protein ABBQ32_007429 [Trebouxia sp. C0010 RCD-2024]
MSRNPSILMVGLPIDSAVVPEHIKAELNEVGEEMRRQGVKYQFVGAGPQECVDKLRRALSDSKVDGVVIGNGYRSVSKFTVEFEQLVNIVRECAPSAKLLFNTTPADTIDAVRRWFPVEGATKK